MTRMGRVGLAWAAICALMAPAAGTAAPVNVAPLCPPKLVTQQSGAAPAGWTAQRLDVYGGGLETILLSDGPPSDQAYLAPDQSRVDGGQTTSIWVLGRDRKDVWLTCQYRGTDVVLTRRLPEGVIECDAVFDDNLGPDGGFQTFSCHR